MTTIKTISSVLNYTLASFFLSFLLITSIHAVNINTADAQEMADSLNGIGMKKAQAIVTWRETNGNFKTVNELSQVKGIGSKTVEKNKEDIKL